jgi:hypothetical protein
MVIDTFLAITAFQCAALVVLACFVLFAIWALQSILRAPKGNALVQQEEGPAWQSYML